MKINNRRGKEFFRTKTRFTIIINLSTREPGGATSIDVEEYFDNMTRSNHQHELNNCRSWTKDVFEQLFA